MHTSTRKTATVASASIALILLAGCAVSDATKDAVASSETVVTQAQQTIGNSESGAMELQRARDHLAQAKKAVDEGEDQPAARHAQQATLDARLATAKAQSAVARKAADDLQASIQTLRQESQRSLASPR